MAVNLVHSPEARIRTGISVVDITPPVGIYHRMWGAAAHDRSTGIHRPLYAKSLAFSPISGGDSNNHELIYITLDHCLFRKPEVDMLLGHIAGETGLATSQIKLWFSHTHGAGLLGMDRLQLPGGELIPEYFLFLQPQLTASVKHAREHAKPATWTFGIGRCSLAANRDYFDEAGRPICGYNPEGQADETVVVGRAVADSGEPLAVLVNYACHPTTLAWENTLISPDYVGSMCELIEGAEGVPCLFAQGASGDVGPVHGFVGDIEIAERNGRQLGHAALSALTALPAPGKSFRYTGPVISGATLGRWDYVAASEERVRHTERWHHVSLDLPLLYRDDLKRIEQVEKELAEWSREESEARRRDDTQAAAEARAMIERANRYRTRIATLPEGKFYPFSATLLFVGDVVFISLDGEYYNVLQREIRSRFPQSVIIIATIANGSNLWYLPDRSSYGKNLYQEEVSIVQSGSLELIIESIIETIQRQVSS